MSAAVAGVVPMPITRDLILRVARAHVEQGRPLQIGLFEQHVHQVAYERAFHEIDRALTSEIAECA